MANQGFVKTLNLDEINDGAQTIQNLAGGTVDADLRVFAGLSAQRSQLFWNRFKNTTEINQSVASLKNGTQFQWDTNYTYTDDDYVYIEPINILRGFHAEYVGFDNDGLISDPLGGLDINFDIGESYTPGTYTNVSLSGGTGTGAKANIVVKQDGTVQSVQISNNGLNYSQGDKLTLSDQTVGAGVGFVIRITALPWTATAVGNFAWDVNDIATTNLRVTFDNCSVNLDGTYAIDMVGGQNVWGQPNSQTTLPYDINRQIAVQEKITDNLDIYDINGNGGFDANDVIYLSKYINGDTEADFTSYLNTNSDSSGSRQTGPAIYRYIDGLAPSVLDVDGTGVADINDINLLSSYQTGNGIIYQRRTAQQLSTGLVNAGAINHAISVTCKIPRSPGSVEPDVDTDTPDPYNTAYFFIERLQTGEWVNIYDNFAKYGSAQTCTVSQADYINTSIGVLKTWNNIQYRIVDKFTISSTYYVKIVASGSGFPNGVAFDVNPTLTPSVGTPVFNKSSEYGIFDSDGSSKFYLRTNPRSTVESVKDMVLFSSSYTLPITESTQYTNQQVPTLTLLPDIVFKRDDSLTLTNIQNLETPEIIDDGETSYSAGQGGFSYGITDGYAGELSNITDNVDESIYLRGTKFRIDRNLYYEKEIKFNGFITSYDPDELNLTQTDLLTDLSPGIYISSSLSQITNPLASDYANKTRSFSSDFNPWTAFPAASKLSTQSLNVTINDLVWTTEIEFDINTSVANGTRFTSTSDLNQTLGQNFAISESNPTSFKLKITINGEVFYLMMKKT